MPNCLVCDSSSWYRIPDPCEGRAVTTAGVIMNESLGKSQCSRCGFMTRTESRFVGESKFYEENYISYYQRPGAATYDRHRYDAMAQWLQRSLSGFEPKRILDVGCGAGWSMAAMKRLYPDAIIEGVEPSHSNSKAAMEAGFTVHVGRASSKLDLSPKYDLVYAKNVLTHVVDIVDFLKGLAGLVTKNGRIVLITVDSTVPTNEFLWCDHNFSFLPFHIKALAEKAGLTFLGFEKNPDDVTILHKQIVVLALNGGAKAAGQLEWPEEIVDSSVLLSERLEYVNKWKALRSRLDATTRSYDRVFNFGASMWTFLLAGNCPEYWDKIERCTVDGADGLCVGKIVSPFSKIDFTEGDAIVLGLNPRTQETFSKRFDGAKYDVLTWGQDILD
jgi:SAM-dependent methyltransferase